MAEKIKALENGNLKRAIEAWYTTNLGEKDSDGEGLRFAGETNSGALDITFLRVCLNDVSQRGMNMTERHKEYAACGLYRTVKDAGYSVFLEDRELNSEEFLEKFRNKGLTIRVI